MLDFPQRLAIETWTLWTLGILLIACRMVSRRMRFRSWTKLQIEDWLMMVVTVTFTVVMVTLNEVAKNGSNFIDDETAASLSPTEVEMAIYGSKMALIMELNALSTIWLVKICLLILYHRLTIAYQRQNLFVKMLFVYCIVAYVLVVGLLLGFWCQPVEQYWALPVQNSECATFYKHMIFATVFNISSDIFLLCVPIPIVIQSRIPLKRKVILCFVLGLGLLNIIMAILNRYYNFSNPNDLIYTYWYVAEISTCVYVGNIPLCWQFIAHVFKMGTWASFGSEQPVPPPREAVAGPQKDKKRFIHSMLPASLWSTHAGNDETTLRTQRKGPGPAPSGLSKTISEEAIMRHDDDDQDIELPTRSAPQGSRRTSAEQLPSRGIS